MHNFKQRNDHKLHCKETQKDKKVLLPTEVWFYKYSVKMHDVTLLAKKQNIHMQALKSLTHIQEIKFKWNAPSSKDSVLSLCFLFSAMTSFSDHFWPKISKTNFFKIDNNFFFEIDNKILAWL